MGKKSAEEDQSDNLDILFRSLLMDSYQLFTFKKLKGYAEDDEYATVQAQIDWSNMVAAYVKPASVTATGSSPLSNDVARGSPLLGRVGAKSSVSVKSTTGSGHDDEDNGYSRLQNVLKKRKRNQSESARGHQSVDPSPALHAHEDRDNAEHVNAGQENVNQGNVDQDNVEDGEST